MELGHIADIRAAPSPAPPRLYTEGETARTDSPNWPSPRLRSGHVTPLRSDFQQNAANSATVFRRKKKKKVEQAKEDGGMSLCCCVESLEEVSKEPRVAYGVQFGNLCVN